MPYLRCPKCKTEQLVPSVMVGLSVDCESCGSEFQARERQASSVVQPVNTGPEINPMVLAKSVGLVVVLLATVAGVWWVAVTLIDRAKQPPAPPVVQQVPAQPQRQVGQQSDLDSGIWSSIAKRIGNIFNLAMALVFSGLILTGVYYLGDYIRKSPAPLIVVGVSLICSSIAIYAHFLLFYDVTVPSFSGWSLGERTFNLVLSNTQERWCHAAGFLGVMGAILTGFGWLISISQDMKKQASL